MKESPIFAKAYDMLFWVNNHTSRYPKSERFRLAKRIEDTAFMFYEQLLSAALSKSIEDKRGILENADKGLKMLVVLFRLAKDNAHMTTKQYLFISEGIVELGKLLTAWKKKEQ